MNKKLRQQLLDLGLNVKNNEFEGIYKDYEISAGSSIASTTLKCYIFFNATDEQKQDLYNDLVHAPYKNFSFSITPFGIEFTLIIMLSFNSTVKYAFTIMDNIINTLDELHIKGKGYCPVCGESVAEEKTYLGKFICCTVHKECLNTIEQENLRQKEEYDNIPRNANKAIIFSLVGGLVTIVIAFVLSLIGFISSWSSLAGAITAISLIKRNNVKIDKTNITIVNIFIIAASLISLLLIYSISILTLINNELITFMEAIEILFEDKEFVGLFIRDVSITLGFSLFSILYTISVYNQYKRK